MSNTQLTQLREMHAALEEKLKEQKFGGHIHRYFLPDGPYAYTKYPKHLAFFKMGATHNERLFMAANRVGKSVGGGYEAVCHATGIYPEWWEGKRFDCPTEGWVAGDTGQTTRDIGQDILLGFPSGQVGTGLIPKHLIIETRRRSGIADAVDTIRVRHISGGESLIGFKSYDQGRRAFQGTGKHWIWFDEECPEDVYGEALLRTMTTNGVIYVTFTPLNGMTLFVQNFLRDAHREAEAAGMII